MITITETIISGFPQANGRFD